MPNIVSALLAIFWLGASSHVLLESAGLIHQDQTHSDGHENGGQGPDDDDDHDAADGRCLLTATDVIVPGPAVFLVSFYFSFCHYEFAEYFDSQINPSGLAPPEAYMPPISSWQFSLRMALAPRAPSFLS